MESRVLQEIMRLMVAEFGQVNGVDTSEWDIRCIDQGCAVSNIPNDEQAGAFREWIRNRRDFMTDIAPPGEATSSWTVVAAG